MNTTNIFSINKQSTAHIHFPRFSLAACLSIALLSSTIATTAFAVDNITTATNAGVAALPPLSTSPSVTPNVIVSFDNSASMLRPAYDDPDFNWRKADGVHNDFDSSKTYYGYFDSEGKYLYDGTNGWFYLNNAAAAGTFWDGNFLNWVTMRRIDVARKVLIGGKVRRARTGDTYTSIRTPVTIGSDDYWVLEAQADTVDSDRDTFVKVENASDNTSSAYMPFDSDSKIWVKEGEIKVDENSDGDWDDDADASYNVHIALKNTDEPTGFLQEKQGDFRIGAAVFNYDHTRLINGTTSGIYQENTTTDGGTLYPCFPDFDSGATPTNYDVCLPTHVKAPFDNIVRVMEEYPLVWGTTPIAETMYTIYGYVAQKDHGINHNTGSPQTPAGPYFFPNGQDKNSGHPSYLISNEWDPFYYDEYSSKVSCCKVHVININDGGAYNDWDDASSNMPSALTTGALGLDVDGDSDPAAADTGNEDNTEFVDDLALYLRNNDIREDLDGHQEIFNYYLFAALGGASASDIQKMKESAANGAFVDYDGDHLPNVAHQADFSTYTSACTPNEWDLNADCSPDGFFNADTGAALETALIQTFQSIRKQVSSGTSAAVLANSTDGVGTIYHSLYQPNSKDLSGNEVEWGGILNALFIDKDGFIREDNPDNGTLGVLDPYAQDRIVSIYYDETQQKTLVQYYNGLDIAGNKIADGGPVELHQLNSIWEARDELSEVPFSETNRTWGTPAQTGRYIKTHITANQLIDFTADELADGFLDSIPLHNVFSLTTTTTSVIGETGPGAVRKVINYIRGQEGIAGLRNRTVTFGKNSTPKPWILGDIIHSTPAVVGPPNKNYNTLHGDKTYLDFKNKYANRRQMIYVGANDGLLHAFNGGFFNSVTQRYTDTPDGLTNHSLGSEIWAYTPLSLLPHLQWLVNPNYEHSFYVDGAPFIFDARVWPTTNSADDAHPKGWGTLMAVTMRLGGSPFQIDLLGDTTATTDDHITRPSMAIFDITDPESEPELLIEFAIPSSGFLTNKPNIIVQHKANTTDFTFDTPSKNEWYLTFGSGPDNLSSVTRTDNSTAKLYILDLANIANSDPLTLYTKDTGLNNQFLGDIQIVDWVRDYDYDTLYVGSVGGTTTLPTGRLLRLDLGTVAASAPDSWPGIEHVISHATMPGLGNGQPFANRPIDSIDIKGNSWIYVGTGRLFTSSDVLSEQPQSFYGVKEIMNENGLPIGSTVNVGELQDVSGVRVFSDNSLLDPKGVITGTQPDTTNLSTVDTFFELEASIETQRGWVINFEPNPNNGSVPSTRNTSAAAQFSQLAIFSSFTPGSSSEICNVLGSSSLHIVYGRTGTAYPNVGLGNATCTNCSPGDPVETLSSIGVGAGQASETIIHRGTAITNLGTGAISTEKLLGVPVKTGRQSWREITDLPAIAK